MIKPHQTSLAKNWYNVNITKYSHMNIMKLPKSMPCKTRQFLLIHYIVIIFKAIKIVGTISSNRLDSKSSSWCCIVNPSGESPYIMRNKLGNAYKYLLGNLSESHRYFVPSCLIDWCSFMLWFEENLWLQISHSNFIPSKPTFKLEPDTVTSHLPLVLNKFWLYIYIWFYPADGITANSH